MSKKQKTSNKSSVARLSTGGGAKSLECIVHTSNISHDEFIPLKKIKGSVEEKLSYL